MVKRLPLAALFPALLSASSTPEYSIQAIRIANSPGDSVADLVMDPPKNERIDTVYALWLIRRGGLGAIQLQAQGLQRVGRSITQPEGQIASR